MRAAVRDAFIKITVAWEGGYINWMFADVYNLVSTGFGLLLDPVAMALTLPWKRQDGTLASRDEIVADFYAIKNDPLSASKGHLYSKSRTKLRIDNADMDRAVAAKIQNNEFVLRKGFPDYDTWPSDAQLAAHSMSWALGPAFYNPGAGKNYFPKLTEALRKADFRTAAAECKMQEATNPGIIPRNRGNRVMFTNAAIAQGTFDPETLFYPTDLESSPVGPDDPTQPALAPVVDFPVSRPEVPLPENDIGTPTDPDDAA